MWQKYKVKMVLNINELKKKISTSEVLFFDLDGTLIDTEPLYFRFWREASKFYGYELSKDEALNMRSLDKNTAIEYLSKVSGGLLDYYKVKEKRVELMSEYLATHPIILKPGAIELLNKYRNECKRVYIVTANTVEKAERIISSLGFMNLIDGIISAKDVKRGKPYPDVYVYASEYVGINPKNIIVFEDSPNGLKSSFNAGCFTVMVEDLTPYTNDMDYVDAFVSNLTQLL